MRVRIKVTQDDILCGVAGSPTGCPVSRAVQRELRGAWRVSNRVARGPDHATVAELPPDARHFIGYFDHYLPVQPFEFDLEVPD